ncbi:hypothetical protein G5714_002740 [Onychostoma macrolepis]|uniref:Uncharacterized protein n=1 Tax=Onychostoma macrolepis TaxID=369639 RepID=A0A7J6D7W0_9TELE|nr:hypothetical protein G5714_002740 [Onychostoma macrolepis]
MSTALSCDCKKAEVLLNLVRSRDDGCSDGVAKAGRPEKENKKRGKIGKTSTQQSRTHCDSSDGEDDWGCLVGVPVNRESRSERRHLQKKPSEPHPEDTVILNDADPEEENEQEVGQGEDDVSSGGEVGETDDAEESDVEPLSQPACKRVYPLRNRKAKKKFTYHTLGQPSIVDG